MFDFYTRWKRQKTFSFLTFSGVIEMEHWGRMVKHGINLSFMNSGNDTISKCDI